ncbi:hypothetical protein [Bacillus horti]|uniref:DUF1292 domain-containing protein n=1 Tax=Caldalkalibacillus horti TaxID=77523 RepID=A0ABT9VXS5_9BACI|nr:hypothetical protein [Bacillus horti]MDQ0165420.1 hypothetical protein [Bacillus horti]
MGQIEIRPELVTSSGEAASIMLDQQYVGSLTLLYREEDRLWGSIQLDEQMLHADEKEEIDLFLHQYMESMIDALGAPECFVSVTYSHYDHIISTEDSDSLDRLIEADIDDGSLEHDTEEDSEIQLSIVGESRSQVEYQLLDQRQQLLAEALIHIDRGDVIGDVFWQTEPSEDDLDEVAHILVADFDSDFIDTFTFTMFYEDEELAVFELSHEDLFDFEDEEEEDEGFLSGESSFVDEDELYMDVHEEERIPLQVECVRDDGDSLTFELYEQDGMKIGQATIDLGGEEPTAVVDFIEPRNRRFREQVAYHMIEELDKETDYHTFAITMQYQDEVVDEYHFHLEDQYR